MLLQKSLSTLKPVTGTFVHTSVEQPNDVTIQPYNGAQIVGHGSLAAGFNIGIFADKLYQLQSDHITMGDFLFAKVEWLSPVSGIKFFVKTCSVSCGSNTAHTIDIIKVREFETD